jgi:hypothetical protein
MNYRLLQCKDPAETRDKRGQLRRGFAEVTMLDGSIEAFDLRGLSSHHQKFRNWLKREALPVQSVTIGSATAS